MYDAYGQVTTTRYPYLFSYGGQWGYQTQGILILCTHRYYDLANGRWLTRDPIGYAGGVNLYGYVGNNPGNRWDPSGYDPIRSMPPGYPEGGIPTMPGQNDPTQSGPVGQYPGNPGNPGGAFPGGVPGMMPGGIGGESPILNNGLPPGMLRGPNKNAILGKTLAWQKNWFLTNSGRWSSRFCQSIAPSPAHAADPRFPTGPH